MARLRRTILGLSVSLTLSLSLVSAQKQNEALSLNASLPETIDWLKSHIPYSHVVPLDKERRFLQREAITHFQAKGCTISYEIIRETLEGSAIADDGPSGFTQERWRINLDGLNPQSVRVEPGKGDRLPRLVFSSFNPREALGKIDPAKTFISAVEPGTVIWHSTRQDGRTVRNGERFVSWGSFSVRDEMKGQAIAEALRHGIGLCHQLKRG